MKLRKTFILKGSLMHRYIPIILYFVSLLLILGCENTYYDDYTKMEVQQLDKDLENRWSTSGVIVKNVTQNGPANKADLLEGELISYIIGEYPINSSADFKRAIKKAIAKDNNLLLYIKEKPPIRIAIRQMGDKVGIEVDDKNTVQIKHIIPGTPASNNPDIKVGDIIDKIEDERKIFSLSDYKDSITEFAKMNTEVKFRTSELIGVKIASITALGNLGDARAVNPLIDILENNPELSLRKSAVKSLEKLVILSGLNPLFTIYREQNVNQLPVDSLDLKLRESAEILGLIMIDPIAKTATLEAPFGIQFRRRSDQLYKQVNDGELVEVAEKHIQLSTEPDQEIRRACLSIIGILKPETSIQPLINVLIDNNEIPGIRFQAGLGLSRIGNPSVDSLILVYHEADDAGKDIIVSSLGTIGGQIARDFLIKTLESTDDPAIQLTLVDAIAKIGDRPSLIALERQRDRFQEDDSAIRIFLDEVFNSLSLHNTNETPN
ncbi:hypothetical protein C6497_08695 [Candidatus Poribacteria bacterium]|nr:MAG: hypothetical protein C6497_08695 [Candidatus Poribacteria bacterium]